jgi:hypothetical protein
MTHHRLISYLSNAGKIRSVTTVITLLAMLIATVPEWQGGIQSGCTSG